MKPLVKALALVLLASCFGAAGSQAGWIENGVPLTNQWGASEGLVIASDGSSGAIIAFSVCQDRVAHVVVQRVDSQGALLWGERGIEICTATGEQQLLQIISDGAGGAIVTWVDYRSGNADIYAQMVNASGAVQWTTDGIALCTATGDQSYPTITSDGALGAIVTWTDGRSGSGYDIYAQRVNASGAVQWTTDGIALCTATEIQESPQIASDGALGAIVTWQDLRSGSYAIYAQRVNASGAVQWTADGISLCAATGGQRNPAIVSDGALGAIVTWTDGRSGIGYDIYAQRVDVSGAVQWTTDGVALCTAAQGQYNPTIVSDGAGGAIVTWYDRRLGGISSDIYAQRVDVSGTVQWTTDGAAICTTEGDQRNLKITSDGGGGAIVTWTDGRSGSDDNIYAQRVNASGAIQWTANGLGLCTATGDQESPQIAIDGAGGAIVTWYDYRSTGISSDIYAQRMDVSGAVQWAVNGLPLCTATGDQGAPIIASDGAGGAIVAWLDGRGGNPGIYAQRVDASGALQWTAAGVPLCTATGHQSNPTITSDGAGGAVVAWPDNRGGTYDIYAQRVNASGVVQWTATGVPLCTATANQWSCTIISDGAGGAIVTWEDWRNGSGDIYAQRVNASGIVQWTADGVALCTAPDNQYYPTITSDGALGAIVTWFDYRNGSSDIYAQRVNASGAIQWTANGAGVCTATGNQESPQVTSDGAHGAIVTWWNNRGATGDVYVQRVNASGTVQWAANGVALREYVGYHQYPRITSDGAGGAIVTWDDFRSGAGGSRYDIYVQRVNASGTIQWTAGGVALCKAASDQVSPRIVSDGAGGAIVTWMDHRSPDYPDIYAQIVNASGTVQWTGDGVALCTDAGYQEFPAISSDGAGGAIVAWEDCRCGALVYAQRIRASGEIIGTLLQNHAAFQSERGIRVDWSLSEMDDGARFSILRASAPEWRFVELESASIETNGMSFTCTDESVLPGTAYKYRVECEVGSARKVLFETEAIGIPALPVTLYQNHPNPFNPQTVIRFYLPEDQEIALDVYNVAGERVARLAQGKMEKGFHQVTWDGRDGSGTACSSGIYFSRLKAGKVTDTRKMILLR